MTDGEKGQLARPAAVSEREIELARELIELSQKSPLPSLLDKPELLECLYYPLRQVPLPQFQFEMLLWDSDKLRIFGSLEKVELTPPRLENGVLTDPSVVYKRTDEYTVLALVYSLSSQMAAVFSNEISQTSWEIVGLFGARDLASHISAIRGQWHTYDTFEKAHEQEKHGNAVNTGEEEDSGYWDRYDKELDSDEPADKRQEEKTEEDYWKSYDDASNGDIDAKTVPPLPETNLASNLILSLLPLYRDCGIADKKQVATAIRTLSVPKSASLQDLQKGLSPQIAYNHTRRVLALLEEQYGPSLEEIVMAAADIIEHS